MRFLNGICRQEVVDIMGELFDNEKIMRSYIEYECKEACEKARSEGLAAGMTEGRAKGMAEGRAKGMAEGRAEGRAEGIEEGRNKGFFEARLSMIKSLMHNTGKGAVEVMSMLSIPENEKTQLIAAID